MACLFGKGILGWVSGGFWDKCPVLNGVWVIFGLMSGGFWVDFGWVSGWISNDFGRTSSDFGLDF